MVQQLSALLSKALPMVRQVESDDYTARERSLLRELVGDAQFFELTILMYRLCSERSRREIREVCGGPSRPSRGRAS
jgi:hypothetical protein